MAYRIGSQYRVAACALARVRKFGFASRLTSAQRRLGRSSKRCRTAGSSNWRRRALFLAVSPGTGIGILPVSRFNSASVRHHLHPLASDLDKSLGKVAVEAVLAALDGLEPPTQDTLEVFG